MTECGHLIGHLAIPNKDGVLTYLPIKCNRFAGHEDWDQFPKPEHDYLDPMSGMSVYQVAEPTSTVDERGCIVSDA